MYTAVVGSRVRVVKRQEMALVPPDLDKYYRPCSSVYKSVEFCKSFCRVLELSPSLILDPALVLFIWLTFWLYREFLQRECNQTIMLMEIVIMNIEPDLTLSHLPLI